MSELKINFSDYKSSGVYFIEIDNSIIQASTSFTARLAVGFCDKGPFNRPIYLSSTADCDELIGGINRKLERKGCFTNRSARTMVLRSPLYLLNLLPVNTQLDYVDDEGILHKNLDKVGTCALSFDMSRPNDLYEGLFADMYERSKFWIADEKAMMNSVIASAGQTDELHSPLFGMGNCGTKDISVIVRKAEQLSGYNLTFREWYGGEDQIPYKWINPDDYVSDYFIQVIAIKGLWDASQYKTYAADPVWSAYFTEKGLKKDKLNKFLHLDAVTVLGNWTGCIIPNFYDKQNKNKSIDFAINKTCNVTGLLFGNNGNALDALAFGPKNYDNEGGVDRYINKWVNAVDFYLDADGDGEFDDREAADYVIDMVGHSLDYNDVSTGMKYLSYDITPEQVERLRFDIDGVVFNDSLSVFTVTKDALASAGDSEDGEQIYVGDYVKTESGYLGRVIKKFGGLVKYPLKGTKDTSTGEWIMTEGNSPEIEFNPSGELVTDSSGNVVYTKVQGYTYTVAGLVKVYEDTYGVYQVRNAEEIPDDDNYESTNPYQDFMVLGTGEVTEETGEDGVGFKLGKISVIKSVVDVYDTLSFIPLKGLKIKNRHMPGYDAEGKVSIEGGIEKIYGMLEDPAIKKGLLNNRQLDFRYVIDTMGGGHAEECGGKRYLSRLAQAKQHCTALISIPSVSDFTKSDAPAYCDTYVQGKESKKAFNAKYIHTGGNQDMSYNQEYSGFSTITEENGAKNCGLFTPYLIYADGTNKILVPPAADVSNTFMNKFLGGDPYVTVANTTGYINNSNVLGLEYIYDQEDCDYLEPNGLNPIVLKNGASYTIYGDRTSYQRVDSDFNFLHVRELLNTIELKCYDVLQDYVFKYNIPQTRSEIYTRIAPILQAMKDAGALVKFDIQIDENNNTKEVIDNKFCIIDIGLWISQNMEKIVTRLTVNRSTTA